MMITVVSQHEKKARTGRVPDAIANRIGDNTWQTIITQEGLRKNIVASCHWIRNWSRTELVWMMDNKDRLTSKISAGKKHHRILKP